MSRETQYIGLNKYAQSYVKNALKVEQYEMTTGMFGEPVTGYIYYIEPEHPEVNSEYRLIEVVQVEPWSSGPMIFTCLKAEIVKKCGQVCDMGLMFEWMVDPSIEGEFDEDTGRYYI